MEFSRWKEEDIEKERENEICISHERLPLSLSLFVDMLAPMSELVTNLTLRYSNVYLRWWYTVQKRIDSHIDELKRK